MRKYDGLLSAISILLVAALVISLCSSFADAERSKPNNPISSQAENLRAESIQGEGNLAGQAAEEQGSPQDETEPPTEETEPPTEETEPPTEETEPPTEQTEPTAPHETTPPATQPEEPSEPETEPTHPSQPDADEPTQPSGDNPEDGNSTTPPSAPEDDSGEEQGGTTHDPDNGGSEDSGNPGDGPAGGDGEGGSEGGGEGTPGGDEDDTPRIYTTLETKQLSSSECPDGILSFVAKPVGQGENLSVKVRLKNNTYSGNGTMLTSADGENYEALLDFNAENTFTLTLWEGNQLLGTVQYRVSFYADKADEAHPEVGTNPPHIYTSLDDDALDMNTQDYKLTVIAQATSDTGARTPIYSNCTTVTLDGRVIAKSSGDAQQEYDLHFEAPQRGDEENHIVRVLAWDGKGNSTMRVYTITYHQISEGDDAGFVTVVLDATTVGLGIIDSGTMAIVEGETAASVVLRFLEEYGYEASYAGNATTNFYLRRISRGDVAYGAAIPARLLELIQRDGLTLTNSTNRDSLGEFDFTMGSGWMYSINGALYAGTGMSNYKVRNGIAIYLRFTLSYGKDIGGYSATGGSYGSLSNYCGMWLNGGYQALGHDFAESDRVEPTGTEDGYIEFTCSKCHEVTQEILPATGEGTDPTEPSETDPTEPEETDPTEPSEPEETDPTEPSEPEETNPTVPSEPESTEPSVPEQTEPQPSEPEATDPPVTDPSEPVDVLPVEPSQPEESTEPEENAEE